MSVAFLVWDALFTLTGIWSFNMNYVLNLYALNLPLEEVLFFICIPFSCMFIHHLVKQKTSLIFNKKQSRLISIIFLLVITLMLTQGYNKLYTFTNSVIGLTLLITYIVFNPSFLQTFFVTYFISIIPFLLVNGLLTWIPIVTYNNAENLSIRIGTIPVEDFIYSFSMLSLVAFIFEFLEKRSRINEAKSKYILAQKRS